MMGATAQLVCWNWQLLLYPLGKKASKPSCMHCSCMLQQSACCIHPSLLAVQVLLLACASQAIATH
jgi:hypothetical protein